MKEIKPTYVTLEQAKLLHPHFKTISTCYYKGVFYVSRNLLYVDGIRENLEPVNEDEIYAAPEHWQVVEWLRVVHGIDVVVTPERVLRTAMAMGYTASVYAPDYEMFHWNLGGVHGTPQEAYSAAFDYVLNRLVYSITF